MLSWGWSLIEIIDFGSLEPRVVFNCSISLPWAQGRTKITDSCCPGSGVLLKSLTCVVLAQILIATIDFVVLGPDALQRHGFLLSWAPRLLNFIECCYPEPRVLLKLLNYPWGNLSLGSHDP